MLHRLRLGMNVDMAPEQGGLAFEIHWRYDESPHNPNAGTNADFLQAKNDINELNQNAFNETSDMINHGPRYDDHTDEVWLAFYRVPQFGICLGKLNGDNVCGAIVRVVPGKCMRVKHTDARDIKVAEITYVCAVPESMGYGTQLMRYLVLTLKPKFDALELKVDKRVKDLDNEWYGDEEDDTAEEKVKRAQAVAADALKTAEQAQKVRRLVSLYRANGFETQTCHCDLCRWNSVEQEHIQMVHRLGRVDGTILLKTEIFIERRVESGERVPGRETGMYESGQGAFTA
jgi:hypothetical protein